MCTLERRRRESVASPAFATAVVFVRSVKAAVNVGDYMSCTNSPSSCVIASRFAPEPLVSRKSIK